MPHIIVKLWPGPTEEQKQKLAELIVRDVMETIGSAANSISVAIEEVESSAWAERVYRSEIASQMERLYKPGYRM